MYATDILFKHHADRQTYACMGENIMHKAPTTGTRTRIPTERPIDLQTEEAPIPSRHTSLSVST